MYIMYDEKLSQKNIAQDLLNDRGISFNYLTLMYCIYGQRQSPFVEG